MFKAKKRRALSGIVTSAILLSAVSVMGLMIVIWANSNLQTHQAELDQTFADNHNKINERILIEHVWFGSSLASINVTMSNTGTLGLNVTEIQIQEIDGGQIQSFTFSDGGILKGGELSVNKTMNPVWIADTAYEISIITNRGNIFSTEVLSP